METKELIDKLEEYIELGHKFKTYELLKAAVRKIRYLTEENEKLRERYAALMEDIKAHAQHPDGRVVYVITEEQLAQMYERHGVSHEL